MKNLNLVAGIAPCDGAALYKYAAVLLQGHFLVVRDCFQMAAVNINEIARFKCQWKVTSLMSTRSRQLKRKENTLRQENDTANLKLN